MTLLMTRVILARNYVLTPFDLRAQIFRVNVELSDYYRGQKKFSKKMTESDLSARKIFFLEVMTSEYEDKTSISFSILTNNPLKYKV